MPLLSIILIMQTLNYSFLKKQTINIGKSKNNRGFYTNMYLLLLNVHVFKTPNLFKVTPFYKC